MLIIGIILFGMLVGAAAQLILGTGRDGIDWARAIVAGLLGSFLGGLVVSLIAGDGVELRPSGIIGSVAGAIVISLAQQWWDRRGEPTAADRAAQRSGDPRKSR
ncbi:GlsB/YeaQ/YmgE family stress response membrane protein [Nocardioides bizhenqiangii]|uniref:GlsB/YeaQ/YmgE family stress response membrane protein n=1 Tax=Nocardioides bizhenqiangii TaxID=3095076 RepID=A0ABZ0ZLN4_9ACTN|nr:MULTISPECIES: GlsB/YeaQ/YmgE family stress response membrane protein [unclassified Nocardioides]MDZ5620119.1 GlsB/YeaQ/YmgE family stress response membrane protein [Nocardioides sp. HM23]MDZ5623472.1 GlsB/YeaQ/YmgE family stress response membrane protein [Nocardioides sp. HM23]WQQ24497.1 GlsB/YeaQ/YmgE family stress response membrane protein [Nocardioides sp. HM61]